MLFRTVYGPELGAIFGYIVDYNRQNILPRREDIYNTFIPTRGDGRNISTQNVDDAINFLKSSGLIHETSNTYYAEAADTTPFQVTLLQALRRLELEQQLASHPSDRIYLALLTELFIKPDQVMVADFHATVNQLRLVQDIGGLGKEKLQAWMRVMEYLGVGRRIQGNFLCVYDISLILQIIKNWPHSKGTLQSFFDDCFNFTLPYKRTDGDLARAVSIPLLQMNNRKIIKLYTLQDSPTRPYFSSFRFRGIAYKESCDD